MSSTTKARPAWWKDARLLLGVVVSAGCLALLLWNVEWDRFWAALRNADYWWLVLSVAALLVAVWLKVLRWQMLVLPVARASRANLFYSISVGYLVNTVLPGRLGELARVYLLARLEGVSSVAILATAAVDRILDVVAVALLLAVVLPTANLDTWMIQSGFLVGAGAVALLGVSLALAYPWGQALFLRLLQAAPRFPGKSTIESWAGSLCLGMEGLRGARAQIGITLLTVAIWLVTVLIYYLGQFAFHIQAPVWPAVLVTALTNLGMVVPSSPGYVGVFHYMMVKALEAYGVEHETALGFAFVIHLVETGLLSILGVYALWRSGVSLMGWRQTAEASDAVTHE